MDMLYIYIYEVLRERQEGIKLGKEFLEKLKFKVINRFKGELITITT
jgi:hypothetical protein